MPAERVGWVTPHSSAARPKCCSFASVMKNSSLSIISRPFNDSVFHKEPQCKMELSAQHPRYYIDVEGYCSSLLGMKVVRLKPYLRAMDRMGLDDLMMRAIELDVVAAPEAHPVVKGLRGVRKARFALP